ncbi:MAG: hypothetical protein HRU22_13275 [Gammaproteobacteria bacterium]|nr:hypothetical protein [Gammaproteobacteria bacterium]
MKKIITLVLALLVSACSSHYESTTAVDDIAYLQLSGNFMGTSLVIDNAKAMVLTSQRIETYKIDNKLTAKLPLSIGTHLVSVNRQGKTIVKRKFYISSGQTFEVIVP